MLQEMIFAPKAQPRKKVPAGQAYWLWEQLADENRIVELINGEVVMVPVTYGHSDASAELIMLLRLYAKEHKMGKVLNSPFAIKISDTMVLEPDIMFIRAENVHNIPLKGNLTFPPDLVVEILSPGTSHRDRTVKFDAYAAFGVREYWLVDLAKKTIEVYNLRKKGEFVLSGRFKSKESVISKVLEGIEVKVKEVVG